MSRRLCLTVLLLLSFSMDSRSHDIGVSKVQLVAATGTNYALHVSTSPQAAFLFASPQLPAPCSFIGNPRGIQSHSGLTFEFSCERHLTAEDTLILPWSRDGIMLTVTWLSGEKSSDLFKNEAGVISVPLARLRASSGSEMASIKRYTALGIEHILFGFDHLAFVLALLLLVRGVIPLIKTITAFTVAHSITLGLATLGAINMPTRPVEAAIALSIIFVAAEIVHARRGHIGLAARYPWLVAFLFGLLHGLGFAGALSAVGLPADEIPIALLFFNLGVEIGQLLFVAAVWGAIVLVSRLRPGQFAWAGIISPYVIGAAATYWFVQRLAEWIQ